MENIIGRVPGITRVALGALFLIFGLNGFFQFLPMPPLEGAAAQFMGGLAAAGYFFPLLKGTEVIVGLLLVSGRFVPLALTVLAPITLNIVAFHLFLVPEGMGLVGLIVLLQGTLVWAYRGSFRVLLDPRAQPELSEAAGELRTAVS